MPQVQIVLATYNGASHLVAQLDSVLAQSHSNWHLIIRDDGSRDQTLAILAEYQQQYPEKILLLSDEENGLGAKGNFARLLEQTSAPYVMCCDQDDVWLPDKIEKTLDKMLELERRFGANTPLLTHTDLRVVNAGLEVLAESFWRYQNLQPGLAQNWRNLLVQNVVTGCATMMNRPLLDLAIPIPSQAIMHDWWLALVASLFGRVEHLEQPTLLYRQHGSNDIGAKGWSWGWIGKRLGELKEIRHSLKQTQQQSAALIERFEARLSPSVSRTLSEYADLSEQFYWQRRIFVVRNGLWKSGWVRNLGLLWAI